MGEWLPVALQGHNLVTDIQYYIGYPTEITIVSFDKFSLHNDSTFLLFSAVHCILMFISHSNAAIDRCVAIDFSPVYLCFRL